jgi:GT2 family glycosyltransferase
MKKISVVIPTYSASHLLRKNLPAIFACCRTGDQVVVVEDAGTDDTVVYLREKYKLVAASPSVNHCPTDYYPQPKAIQYTVYANHVEVADKSILLTVVELKNNLRFAGAANLGMLFAEHELVFLCNNDVLPQVDCLTHLAPYFEDGNVFAVGCLEYESTEQGQKSGKNILFFRRGLFQHSRAINFESGETAWASGGSAVFEKAKWLALNGFDRVYYPAYWEDIDISFRARKKGWKVLFESAAVVYHKHESTHSDVFGQQKIDAMSWRNAQIFTWKNGTLKQKIQYIVWWMYWSLKRNV